MNARTASKPTIAYSLPLLLFLVVALLCSACATTGTTSDTNLSAPHTAAALPPTIIHIPAGPITYVSHLPNLGISGIHLHDALSEELPIALSTSPELVTVWLVANDFVGGVPYDAYIHDLNTLLGQLHSNTHASLVMANLPDLTRLPTFANQTPAQKAQMLANIQRWNVGIVAAAARYGVTLVDLFSHGSQLTAHPEYISGDGFHPSPAGYVQLANLFWQAIKG